MPSILQVGKQVSSLFGGGLKLAAKGAYRGATAGPLGRAAFGAGVGGVLGFATSDFNSPTLTMDATLRGALVGGIAGFGAAALPKLARGAHRANMALGARAYERSLVGPRLPGGSFYSMGPLGRRLASDRSAMFSRGAFGASPGMGMLRLGGRGARGGASAAFKMGRFAFEHPLATGAAIGGAMLATNAAGMPGSPTMGGVEMRANYNQQAMAAAELQMSGISPMGGVGSAPQMMGPMHRAMARSTDGLVQGLHRGRH